MNGTQLFIAIAPSLIRIYPLPQNKLQFNPVVIREGTYLAKTYKYVPFFSFLFSFEFLHFKWYCQLNH